MFSQFFNDEGLIMNSQITLDTLPITPTRKRLSKSASQAMVSRHICPCCGRTLLRHARSGGIYWRCSTCYQEMPV